MLKNLYYQIFDRKKFFSSSNDFKEFENYRIGINTSRTNICITLLFPLMLFLSCFSVLFYNRFKSNYLHKKTIFFLHIFLCIICVLWCIYYKLLYNNLKFIYNLIIYWTFINLIICATTLIGLYNPNNYSEISAYIMIIFIACAIFYIPPATSIPTFGISYLITILFIFYNNSMPLNIKISAFISCTIGLLFSLVISYNLYLHFFNNYKRNLELLRTNKRLEELESSKSLYFTNFSHELKTPLTILKGHLSGMLNGVAGYEDHLKYLQRSLTVTEKMETLIKELLYISKMDTSETSLLLTNTDFAELLRAAIAELTGLISEKKLSLYVDIPDRIGCLLDKAEMERALQNILVNAIRYSPEGERVIVTAKETSSEISCTVENTGVKIPETTIRYLFEPFYRVDNSRNGTTGGTGLGLYIVRGILENHNAEYGINNTEDGVCFWLRLPKKQ